MMITKEQLVYKDQYKYYTFFLAYNAQVGCTNGYVKIKPKQNGYDYPHDYCESDIQCHGGITFDEYDKHHNRIIGFDTAHSFDAFKWNPSSEDSMIPLHRWTKSQLIDQCKTIIDQLTPKYRVSYLPF